ncbi:hypothetical protein NC651_026013 [Populus alba x Populus x berolinensis]|nr:hypothetical protein NC651_026013 [Populus alba x Populus x berolinensis]
MRFLELPEFNQNYGYIDKMDLLRLNSGKRGDYDGSAILRSTEEEVPDSSGSSPKIPSPPTASGFLLSSELTPFPTAATLELI